MQWIELAELIGFVAAAIVFAEVVVRLLIDPDV